MKINAILDVFKRRQRPLAVSLEYVIIYENSGQPIYIKCWGNVCGMLGKQDELVTAFLSAISTMPKMFAESDNKVHSMGIGSLKLLFCYTASDKIICLAFPENHVNNNTMEIINNLFKEITYLVDEEFRETPWDRVNDPRVQEFGKVLHEKVIHPWFYLIYPEDSEEHEENCPICIPMILESCS